MKIDFIYLHIKTDHKMKNTQREFEEMIIDE